MDGRINLFLSASNIHCTSSFPFRNLFYHYIWCKASSLGPTLPSDWMTFECATCDQIYAFLFLKFFWWKQVPITSLTKLQKRPKPQKDAKPQKSPRIKPIRNWSSLIKIPLPGSQVKWCRDTSLIPDISNLMNPYWNLYWHKSSTWWNITAKFKLENCLWN